MKDFQICYEAYRYDDKESGTINCDPEIERVFYKKANSLKELVEAIKKQKSVLPQFEGVDFTSDTRARIHLDTSGRPDTAEYSMLIVEGVYDPDKFDMFEATNKEDLY